MLPRFKRNSMGYGQRHQTRPINQIVPQGLSKGIDARETKVLQTLGKRTTVRDFNGVVGHNDG